MKMDEKKGRKYHKNKKYNQRQNDCVENFYWNSDDLISEISSDKMTDGDCNSFLTMCDAFENVLNLIDVTEDSKHIFTERLIEVIKSITKKINIIDGSPKNISLDTLAVNLTKFSSKESLFSQSTHSSLSIDTEYDCVFEKFLNEIMCPFCYLTQPDTVVFVKHIEQECISIKSLHFNNTKKAGFTIFQILPNNFLKCNVCFFQIKSLQHYFKHINSNKHKEIYKDAKMSRKYLEEFVFCSCCRNLVENTYIQLNYHLKFHEKRKIPLLKNGICFLFNMRHEFKCILCDYVISPNYEIDKLLNHFKEQTHLKLAKRKLLNDSKIFCEFCNLIVSKYELYSHFYSFEHKRSTDCNSYLCFYCGYEANCLKELANHMYLKCKIIQNIRTVHYSETSKRDLNKLEIFKAKTDSTIHSNSIESGTCLFLKGLSDISKIVKYFSTFGEIIAVGEFEGDLLIIEFENRNTVSNVMSQNINSIDGLKVEISSTPKVEISSIPDETTNTNKILNNTDNAFICCPIC